MAPKRKRDSLSNDHEITSSSRLIYKTVKGTHEFKIEGYSLTKGAGADEFKTSGKFTVGGYDWVIRFYPDGDADPGYVSLFLELVSTGEVRALVGFKLIDQSGKEKHGSQYQLIHTFKFGTAYSHWGYTKYIKKSALEASTSSYLKDDCLIIHCTVGVIQTRVEEEKNYVIPVPPSDMIQNLKSFLESEIDSDITFQVGNEFFRAHKWILAAQSPVFRAQFYGLVGNPDKETIVVIEELEPFVFQAMLLFMYSDELPEPHELSDSNSPYASTTVMQHLLAAANRYQLARLKVMCAKKLHEELTANSVATTLSLAHQYGCPELKTLCLNFAAKPENLGEVMKSDGYADLEKSCPSLLTELLKTTANVQ